MSIKFRRTILRLAVAGLVSLAARATSAQAQVSYQWMNFVGQPGGAGNVDGIGSTARFDEPSGVAMDGSGNIYLADRGNSTIRKLTPAGVVTTFAGSAGVTGSTDGTGSAALFNQPNGVAVDGNSNVYVAEHGNNTIRKITPAGVVTTLAGSPFSLDDYVDATGSDARFNHPSGLAVDGSGNVYVADTDNDVIRKITPAGVVTTLAGSAGSIGSNDGTGSAALFNQPTGVAVDGNGNVYVADTQNSTIRKVTPAGVVTTLAGNALISGTADGTGSTAQFLWPAGLAVDASANLYVSDNLRTIRKVTPAGVVTTLAGNLNPDATYANGFLSYADGTGGGASFDHPEGIAVDGSGNLYVADLSNDTIRKVTPDAVVTTLAGSAPTSGYVDAAGSAARFDRPDGVAVDASGNLYVGDDVKIRKITPAGVVSTLAGSDGGSPGYVDAGGGDARFAEDTLAVAVDGSGNVYVADTGNEVIRKVTPDGLVTTLAGSAGNIGSLDGVGTAARFDRPEALTVDASGNVYVADTFNETIRKITPDGAVTTLAGSAGNIGNLDGTGSDARFREPVGVAVDGSGNVYVVDRGNFNLRKVTPSGVVTTLASHLEDPSGVAIDGSGNVYVTEDGDTVEKVSPAGLVTTIGGSFRVKGGADGIGTAALFSNPAGVAVDGSGTVYVLDSGNNRISKGIPIATPPIITSAGSVNATAGQKFIYQIVATNNPTSFGAINLPQGLSLNSTFGVISGRPVDAGTVQVILSATNSSGTGSAPLTINISAAPPSSAPVVNSGSVTARTGQPFNYQVVASGVTSAARISASGLPSGLTIDSTTGVISGTVTSDGSFVVNLTLTDGSSTATGSLQLTFTSDPAFPVITSASTVPIAANQPFTYTITTSGGSDPNDPVTFSISDPLPRGLTFDPATGIISGTLTPPMEEKVGGAALKVGGAALVKALTSPSGEVIATVQIFAHNSHGTSAATLTFVGPLPPSAVNISTRLTVGSGDNVLIGGFIVTGTAPKKVIVRAIGPSLNINGTPIAGTLQDPMLELHASDGSLIQANDNWKSDQAQAITDSNLAPADDRESAIVATLQPGNYTAIVKGQGNTTGIALVEVFDLDTAAPSQMAEISTRGTVQTGDNVMIGGFFVSGDIATSVLVRGIGPELAGQGVPGALQDTTLDLFDSNGTVRGSNDDWQSDQEQAIRDTTVPPGDARESAIVTSLSAGGYTAIVRGKNGTTGVALVEVYVLRP